MTVLLGTMSLPAPEDADLVRTYLNGTHGSGGLWEALTRSSNHDHTGGANGKPISVSSIPDGSITTGKLDPAVLLPYALVDGSKPFTGQVTMQADAVVRDALYFGQQGTALAPDATLSRTGVGALRVDTHLGVGVAPGAWGAGVNTVRVGEGGLLGVPGGAQFQVLNNSLYNGTNTVALVGANPGHRLRMDGTGILLENAPAVAAGATQTFTTRAAIANTGTLTLTPDTNQLGLAITPVTLKPWAGSVIAAQIGPRMHLVSGGADAYTAYNTYFDGTTFRLIGADAASRLYLQGPNFSFQHSGSAAADAAFTWVTRMAVNQTGTLTLTPDAGVAALVAGVSGMAGQLLIDGAANGNIRLHGNGYVQFHADGGYVQPDLDNNQNFGSGGARWAVLYAVNGTIQTSSADMKEGITPLSPAECYQAAKDVRWYEYAYLPPAYTPPEPPPDIAYDAADDNETKAEKKAARDEAEAQAREAHAKMLVETAPARNQRGFVFPAGAESKDEAGGALPPVPDLFGLSDRESTTPQADLATLGAAMQELIRRFEIIEARMS